MEVNAFDSIHNIHERAVISEVIRQAESREEKLDHGLLADVACVALNQLPGRYIRHDVDFSFYQTQRERAATARAISNAVAKAFDYVLTNKSRQAA